MELKYLRGKVEIKKDNSGITVVMSDETLDRHGDVLPIDQWNLTKFMQSPRMLVDHNHEVASIVGKWENTRIEGKQLIADANFHNFTDLAKAVKQMVDNGYLDTVSVGFIPHGPEKDGGKDSFELIETSWVTVPANPSARTVKDLLSKTTPDAELAKVKEFIGEKKEEAKDDVFAGLPVKEINSVQDFKDRKTEYPDSKQFILSTSFIEKLIDDSEKLQTLTAAEAADAEKEAKRGKEMKKNILLLREIARQVNGYLHQAKK